MPRLAAIARLRLSTSGVWGIKMVSVDSANDFGSPVASFPKMSAK